MMVAEMKAAGKSFKNFTGGHYRNDHHALYCSLPAKINNCFTGGYPGYDHNGFTGTQISTTNFPSFGSSGYISKHGFSSGW